MNTPNPYQQNVTVIKNYARKPILFWFIVVSSVSLILSAVSSVMISTSITPIMNDLFSSYISAFDSEAALYASTTASSVSLAQSIISAVFSLAVSALPVIAMIIIYVKSKNPSPSSNPKGGVTFLWVITLISMISMCVCAGLCIISLLICSLFLPIIWLSLGVSIILIIETLYYIFAFSAISSVKKSLSSIYISAKGSKSFSIISLIMGIYELLFIPAFIYIAFFGNTVNDAFGINISSSIYMGIGMLSAVMSFLGGVSIIISSVMAKGFYKYIKSITVGNTPIPVRTSNNTTLDPSAFIIDTVVTSPKNTEDDLSEEENPYIPDIAYENEDIIPNDLDDINSKFTKEDFSLETDDKEEDFSDNSDDIEIFEEKNSVAFCNKCGNKIKEEDIFCTKCGNRVR
ncbi:MAG: zinc ribbon domain-containing protein [Acutalibacteraceae bacterium]